MKAREKMSGRIILALLVAALAAALAGCPNLSRDLDLKAAIEEDVREANAEQITVRILPENDAMGLTNPYGTASVKLGVAFRVSTTVSSEYAFVRWEKTAGDGDVSFADATSPETMATVSGNGVGIEITARFDARPVVVIKEPEGTGVLVNAPIAITFSEDVDDSMIILDETVLVRVSPDKVSWSSPVGVTLAKSVSGSLVTISLTAGTYGVNYYVRVDVLKSVTDLDGHMMPQGMFWWFKTGSQEDTEDPNLVSFVLKDGAAVITDGGATNRTTGLTIATTATDNLTVTTMRVRETDLTTLVTAEITRGYSPNLTYSLQTAGDGPKHIEVVVLDGVNNESNIRSQDVVLDTAVPTMTSVSINGGAAVTTGTSITVALGADDDRTGLTQYQLSEAADFTGGTTTAWTAWTPTPGFTLSAGDGTRTVYARVRDGAGNISTEAVLNHDSITLDAAGPTFSSAVVLAGGAAVTTGTTVSIAISAADVGSAVAHYRLSEAADFSGGTTTAWTPVPLPATCTLSAGDGLKTIYVQLRDTNGNLSTEAALNHDSLMLDQQGPTFSSAVVLGGGAAATATTSVAISIAATDAGSSVANYRLSEASDFTGAVWTPVPLPTTCTLSAGDGLKTIYVQLRDANGNTSTEAVLNRDSITLDQTGPAFSSGVVLGGGAAYTGSTTVSISIDASDAATVIAHYRLSEAADFTGGTTTAWTAVPLPTTCALSTGSGAKTVYVQLRDSVGNVSTEAVLNRDSITLDQQVPTFSSTVSIEGGAALTTSQTVDLSISATDALSGIDTYQMSEASDFSGGTTTGWLSWTGSPQATSFTLGADGTRTVYVRLRDVMGNVSTDTTQNHDSITLDAAGPTFSSTVSLGGGAATTTSTTVSLSISAADAGSSVAEYRLSEVPGFTGGTTTAWTAVPLPTTYTFAAGEGQRFVYVELKDANGNVSTDTTQNHDDISLDQAAPVFSSQVSINSGAAGTKSAAISLAISATDAGSSIAHYQLSEAADFTGGTTTAWTAWTGSPVSFTLSPGNGTKTVYVRLRDANSHVSTEATLNHDDIVLDTAAPQITDVTFSADNSSAVVTFNENIYGDAALGDLASDALALDVKTGPGVVASQGTSRTGAAQATVVITWTTPPVTGNTIAVQARSATSVYDSVGNAMAANAGLDGTAKRLSFSAASHGAGGTGGAVQTVLSSFRGGSFSFPVARTSGMVAAQQSATGQQPATGQRAEASRAQAAAQPLVQFHRPITADAQVPRGATVAAAPAEDVAETIAGEPASATVAGGSGDAARTAQAAMPGIQTLASLEVRPAQDERPSSPWLVLSLALGAGLLAAGGLAARRFIRRGAATK